MSTEEYHKPSYHDYLKAVSQELNDLKSMDVAEMFRYLMNFGDMLEPLKDGECTDTNFVHGCVSNAYVVVERHESKPEYVRVRGHSDVMVVKGFMGVIANVCAMMPMSVLLVQGKQAIDYFLRSVELDIILTPTRANAFGNIIAMIFSKTQSLFETLQ